MGRRQRQANPRARRRHLRDQGLWRAGARGAGPCGRGRPSRTPVDPGRRGPGPAATERERRGWNGRARQTGSCSPDQGTIRTGRRRPPNRHHHRRGRADLRRRRGERRGRSLQEATQLRAQQGRGGSGPTGVPRGRGQRHRHDGASDQGHREGQRRDSRPARDGPGTHEGVRRDGLHPLRDRLGPVEPYCWGDVGDHRSARFPAERQGHLCGRREYPGLRDRRVPGDGTAGPNAERGQPGGHGVRGRHGGR